MKRCFCESDNSKIVYQDNKYITIQCDECGEYSVSISAIEVRDGDRNTLSHFLFHECKNRVTIDNRYLYIIDTWQDIESIRNKKPENNFVSLNEIANWYPKNFSEKVDKILLCIAKLSKYEGHNFRIEQESAYRLFFVNLIDHDIKPRIEDNTLIFEKTNLGEREEQFEFINSYLINNNLAKFYFGSLILLPEGLKRIDDLQKNFIHNKKVFVAMSFEATEEIKNIREVIRKAIKEAKYEPIIIDEVHHNNQIMPEMLYQIKHCKFTIADFTKNNNGVYYEAGFALGLGKTVIHTCHKDWFDKIHFDIKQKNTICYESLEDLSTRLIQRIKASFD
jgi:nucleoside 2-deoxyribosyltransferase